MYFSPKISVIMPSLNVEDYMEECLKSVLNQTFTDIEVICVDAGSTDNTLNIIKKLQKEDKRIKLLKSDKKSYGYQMNIGIEKARGNYISIVETDDFIEEDMLEKLYNLSENNSVDIIKANFCYLNDYDKNNIISIKDDSKEKLVCDTTFKLTEQPLFIEGHPSIWAGIYSKEFLINNNIKFKEEPKGGWVDNPFFFETALKADKIRYVDEIVYNYRITNPNSSSNNLGDNTLPMKRIMDIYNILKNNNVTDHKIIKLFYNRVFRYIEIIIENNENNIDNLDYETCACINKVLNIVDEKIVNFELNQNFRKLYYKFMSPLTLLEYDYNIFYL